MTGRWGARPRRRGGGPARARELLAAELERERLEEGGAPEAPGGDPGSRRGTETLGAVAAAMDAAAVPHLVVPPDAGRVGRVVVPAAARRRARRALRPLAGRVRVSPGPDGGPDLRVAPVDAPQRPAPGTGCEIAFRALKPTLPDRLWQVRWRAPGHVPHRGPATVDEVELDGRRYPTARTVGSDPRVDEVTFPVDVVYTWVDGTDPAWRARKAAARRELDAATCAADADDPSRYHSHEELRYSLRSVAGLADFVRHVFVVTDGQVPAWLDTDHERLTVVDHTEIFPDRSALPTFNSHAIESRLHHIPGLAEHYLYLNDDFFLGRRVTPEHFFHASGATRYFPSPARIPLADPPDGRAVDAAAQNTRAVVHQRFGRLVDHKIKHAPYPQRRSVLFEMEEVLADEFARTTTSRLRSAGDVAVPSSLYHYYASLTGRAVPGRIASRYVSLGEGNLGRRLSGLRRRRDFDVLCVNDSPGAHLDDPRRRSRLLERFMASCWPTPSPFER